MGLGAFTVSLSKNATVTFQKFGKSAVAVSDQNPPVVNLPHITGKSEENMQVLAGTGPVRGLYGAGTGKTLDRCEFYLNNEQLRAAFVCGGCGG